MLISVACLSALTFTFAFSQEINVRSSLHGVHSSTVNMHKVFGHDSDNFYVVKFYGNQYYLEKLDGNLNFLAAEPIKLFNGIKTYKLEYVVHFCNEIYVFVSRTRLTDIGLFYQRIDKTTLRPTSEWIELTTVENIRGAWAEFHFALSRKETRLMVFCRTKLGWARDQFNEIYVFGENLSPLWKRRDSFSFRGQGPRDNKYVVDEEGNVSVLSLVKRESIISLFREVKNQYTIYRYTHDGKDFREYAVTLPDRYIRGLRIAGGEDGELVCAGLYSDDFHRATEGTFFFRIEAETGQMVFLSQNPFERGLIAELDKLNEPMLNQESLLEYVVSDLVMRANGKVMLIAEQVFAQTYNTYNNLIITCLDMEGRVYWTRVVAKRQDFNFGFLSRIDVMLEEYRSYVMETGYLNRDYENLCSYALMAPIEENSIILFYNDDIRNRNPEEKLRGFNRPKKSYLAAVTIDEFGNLSRKALVEWKKKQLFPEPIRFYDTRSHTVVIPALRYRSYNYYRIDAEF